MIFVVLKSHSARAQRTTLVHSHFITQLYYAIAARKSAAQIGSLTSIHARLV